MIATACLTGATAMTQAADYQVFFTNSHLHVKVGDYEMRFAEGPSWTFRDVTFADKQWMQDSGWLQPVLNEKDLPPAIKDPFLGTGHRHEQVDEVTIVIHVDNTTQSVDIAPTINIKGLATQVSITKKSRFLSAAHGHLYDHLSEVAVTAAGVHETYHFTAADGDLSKVNFLYAFMHIWPNSSKYWVVGDDQGQSIEQGTFKNDMSFTLNKPFRWAFIYDPKSELGTVYLYPAMSPGENKFWNRKRDNKLYLTVDPPRKQDARAVYRLSLYAFKSPEADWQKKAQAILRQHLTRASV